MKFDGVYLADGSGTEDMSSTHYEALELLQIIHTICKKKKLPYTLVGSALLCHVKGKSFAEIPPNIHIALKYTYFQILQDELRKFVEHNPGYILADKENCKQFTTLSLWFAKKNLVNLPDDRKEDEIYYDTHLEIIPAFFAGNNRWEFYRTAKSYTNELSCLNARAPSPQIPISLQIKNWRKNIGLFCSLRKRDTIDLKKSENRLAGQKEAKYCFCPPYSKIMCLSHDLENVVESTFAGQACYISRGAEKIVGSYPNRYKEKILKYRVNDLHRKGGETLRRVQLIQTEILAEFDRVCRKNNIRYTIAFGTLLGAVRHKGFIPWDDDVDVIVPIEDYLRLDKAMEEDLDTSRFFWRTIDTETDYNLTYKHLKRNDTIYMKPGRTQFKFHKGVLIDVFPVFHSADNRLSHWIQKKVCFFFRRATWAYMGSLSEPNPVLRFLYNQMKKRGPRKNYESFMKYAMKPRKNSYYSYFNGVYRSPYHTYYLSEEAFQERIELEFEGHKFFAPRKYNEALSYCYGKDYLLYPRMGKRMPSHFAIIDLGGLYQDELSKNPGKANTAKGQKD